MAEKDKKGYRAEQAADGTWTIYDVPVFAAHVDDRGRDEVEFSARWLKKALRKAQVRADEGYLPPLHVRHHGDPEGVRAAGKFRLTRMGMISHGGEKITALFADLVGVRPAVYEAIRRGELSYRSVEILDVDVPEIDSLALLDDEVPFFRFENLRIAEEKPQKTRAASAALYRAVGDARGIVWKLDATEDTMAEEKTFDAAEEMVVLLKAIAAKLGVGAEEEVDEPEAEMMAEDEEEEEEKKAAAPVVVGVPGSNSGFAAEGVQAGMAAQLAAVQAELSAMKAQREIDEMAGQLSSRGYNADSIKKFRSVASDHGIVAAKTFAQGLEQVGPADPPRQWSGDVRQVEQDPPEVSKFAQQGPEALEEARSLWRSWKRTGSTVNLDTYIQSNLNPAAFIAAARLGGK